MQTFCAENMAENGFESKTFSMELDTDTGMPVVHVVRVSKCTSDIHALGDRWNDQNAGYAYFLQELQRQFPDLQGAVVYYGMMSMAQYQGPIKPLIVLAHTALGAHPMGLFSNAALHTWHAILSAPTSTFAQDIHRDLFLLIILFVFVFVLVYFFFIYTYIYICECMRVPALFFSSFIHLIVSRAC